MLKRCLKGELATADRLVQTACILPLPDTLDSRRHVRDVVITARREHLPRKGREHEPVVYPADTVRILRDNGRYYLLAIPKYSVYSYERDLKFAPDSESVGVDGFRFVSSGGVRSRKDVSIVNEKFDLEKVRAMARDGRVYLYSLEVGVHRPLFDATYALANRAPCRIVTTIPQLFAPGSVSADAKSVKVRLAFTFNPSVPRVNRKFEGRSWKSYCDAYPSDSRRTVVRWQPPAGEGDSSLRDACRRVVETDGVLLVDDRDVKPALEAMGYVVTQTGDPNAAGGIYRGYMIADRVFRLTDGRVERCAAKGGKCRAPDRRSALVGKPLVEALSAAKAAEAEAEFVRLVEANSLTDRKTAAVFTLEAPVVVGNEFKEMVAREFRRVVYTGTMSWKRQLVRPAREVALGIWLARLEPCPSEEDR